MFDIAEHVENVIQARRGGEQVGHLWLFGFHKFSEGAFLDLPKANEYLERVCARYPPFTKLSSSTQLINLFEAILEEFDFESPIPLEKDRKESFGEILGRISNKSFSRDIISMHLPFDDSYHLEFPLVIENDRGKFVYTSRSRCEGLEEHGFPEISLRQSVNLSLFLESSQGAIMYDNRVSVNRQDRETMVAAYKSFGDFVGATKV